ncbi:LON peptidase substrate-binding domain-containing protein [Photobacterium atrarenae]|uniref:LON peptidase substrate-binding domain-containing protein n=1 Tax=Photobacterium atrarenae TaxID=865757 RepID=A0ABY5GC36_9GAMM|nr:LON peptidase substrate-binding domain-containing protein [Photobacterium atrarenae]UTV26779.1 LON peptidase substrate-binding domain-containing protein [Photobacterium atrarenae]
MADIALYPSSKHLLPQGRLELVITEERFIRMIKQSLNDERSFALCMLNEFETHDDVKKIPAIATEAKIVDFNADENGLLSIIAEGVQLIRILAIEVDQDGLLHGTCQPHPTWPDIHIDSKTMCLADKLKMFYQTMPELGALYPTPNYHNVTWVCQRWLEILPLEAHYKQLLLTQETVSLTIRFLLKLLDTDDEPSSETA